MYGHRNGSTVCISTAQNSIIKYKGEEGTSSLGLHMFLLFEGEVGWGYGGLGDQQIYMKSELLRLKQVIDHLGCCS